MTFKGGRGFIVTIYDFTVGLVIRVEIWISDPDRKIYNPALDTLEKENRKVLTTLVPGEFRVRFNNGRD